MHRIDLAEERHQFAGMSYSGAFVPACRLRRRCLRLTPHMLTDRSDGASE